MKGFSIRAGSHTYVTLYWNDKFVFCCDNDFEKAEDIIEKIEKRTGMKITDIPIIGRTDDFDGFFWRGRSGWHNLLTGI